jgi:hypothetical protein
MENVTIHGLEIKVCRVASHRLGPDDTHLAWGAVGHMYGGLFFSRYGITEELVFVWESTRPATPVMGPQLADMPHVQRAIERKQQAVARVAAQRAALLMA